MLNASGHPELLLDALALDPLLLQTLARCLQMTRTLAPLLDNLAPHYAVDDDGTRLDLHSARRYAQKLPSIVEAADGEATYHLVPIGCLILDVDTNLGEYGRLLCDRPHEALAAGLLIRLQVVIDEVGSEKLL